MPNPNQIKVMTYAEYDAAISTAYKRGLEIGRLIGNQSGVFETESSELRTRLDKIDAGQGNQTELAA